MVGLLWCVLDTCPKYHVYMFCLFPIQVLISVVSSLLCIGQKIGKDVVLAPAFLLCLPTVFPFTNLVTISEGTEERVSNFSSSRDLCVTNVFFPNAWEQISIQSLLLELGVKVRNGKSENEVSLHFF